MRLNVLVLILAFIAGGVVALLPLVALLNQVQVIMQYSFAANIFLLVVKSLAIIHLLRNLHFFFN